MNDEQTIDSAYNDTLRKMFVTFVENTIVAKTDEARAKEEERFKTGLATVRKIRARALQLVSEP